MNRETKVFLPADLPMLSPECADWIRERRGRDARNYRTERDILVYKMRICGVEIADIARQFDVTTERIRQVLKAMVRRVLYYEQTIKTPTRSDSKAVSA